MINARRLKFVLRMAVSVVLLGYLFSRVGWAELSEVMLQADLFFLVLYIILGLLATFVSSLKWWVLAQSHDIPASLTQLFLLYMVGYFFNQILPTSVGGDVVRGYELGRHGGKKLEAMASVFMERFTGLTVLMIFVLIALLSEGRLRSDLKLVSVLALAFAGYFVMLFAVLNRTVMASLEKRVPFSFMARFLGKARRLQESILMYSKHRGALVLAMVLSLVFYVVSVFIVYVGCRAFHLQVPVGELFWAVPVMLLLFMIPVSVGGIGLQEWAYYFVLGKIGVPGAIGLSLGLLYRLRSTAFGLVGGALYPLVTDRSLTNAAARLESLAKPTLEDNEDFSPQEAKDYRPR